MGAESWCHFPSPSPGPSHHQPIALSLLKKLCKNRIFRGMHLRGSQLAVDEWMDEWKYGLRGDPHNSFDAIQQTI